MSKKKTKTGLNSYVSIRKGISRIRQHNEHTATNPHVLQPKVLNIQITMKALILYVIHLEFQVLSISQKK